MLTSVDCREREREREKKIEPLAANASAYLEPWKLVSLLKVSSSRVHTYDDDANGKRERRRL